MKYAIFNTGLVLFGMAGIVLGIEAYAAGFTWIGATILGGAIFLALGWGWRERTGVSEKVRAKHYHPPTHHCYRGCGCE